MLTVTGTMKDDDGGITIQTTQETGDTITVYIPPVMIDALCDMLDLPFPNPTAGTLDTRAR